MTTITDKLAAKAQALVDRWDSPLWKDLPHTGEFINELRQALADYASMQAEPQTCIYPSCQHNGCRVGCDGKTSAPPLLATLPDGRPAVIPLGEPSEARVEAAAKPLLEATSGLWMFASKQEREEFRQLARAVLKAADAVSAGAPEGFVLVPVEPTPEMSKAAVVCVNGNAVYKSVAAGALEIEEEIYAEVYRAMLAAAPGSEPVQGKGE